MTFSDKFQTINLHEILNLHPDDQYDHNNDPENETVEKNVDLKLGTRCSYLRSTQFS